MLGLKVSPALLNLEYNTWLAKVFHILDDKNKKLMCLAYWALWFARQKLIHDGVMQSTYEIVVFVKGYLADLEGVMESLLHKTRPLEIC